MVRRIALGLLTLILALGLAASGWARPGGGQNYRAPTRSYSPPTRSYSPPPHSYTPPPHSYTPPSSYSNGSRSGTTYVSTPTYGPTYQRSSSAGTIFTPLL